MIYLFSEYERITPEIEQMLIDKLPPKRRERTLRFKHRGGRLSCLLGYLLFLYGFRNIYKESALPDFDVTSSGKPYLKDYPDIHFNISHCNGAVACIFSDMAVGLDIQEMREMSDSILNKVCSNEEIEQIQSSAEPTLEFCRVWSVKEALSKLSGKGIVFGDIKTLSPRGVNINSVFIEPDKYMTSASYDKNADFSIHKLSLSQLIKL
jgi:4'-phosphopantetheinyl transferase